MGHFGANRVIELARERFYWPFMRADITHYLKKNVCLCQKQRKPTTHVNAPLQPISSTELLFSWYPWILSIWNQALVDINMYG